jgi:hypothetical protein
MKRTCTWLYHLAQSTRFYSTLFTAESTPAQNSRVLHT